MSIPSIPTLQGESTIEETAWTRYIIGGLLFYIVLCSLLRYQRRDAKLKQFNFPDRKSLSRMTNVEAQAIITYLAELEFPKIYYTSVQYVKSAG